MTDTHAMALQFTVLDHRDANVELQVQALIDLASAQEARLLGLTPKTADPHGVRSSPHLHLGAVAADGTLLGLLCIGADDEAAQLAIHTLVVRPSAQRRGVARALLLDALARGPGMAFAVVTAQANLPALALYRQQGFEVYRHGVMAGAALPVVKLRRAAPAAIG